MKGFLVIAHMSRGAGISGPLMMNWLRDAIIDQLIRYATVSFDGSRPAVRRGILVRLSSSDRKAGPGRVPPPDSQLRGRDHFF